MTSLPFRIFIALGMFIGIGLAVKDHDGRLLLGFSIYFTLLLVIEYQKYARETLSLREYLKNKTVPLIFVLLLLIFALAAPLFGRP